MDSCMKHFWTGEPKLKADRYCKWPGFCFFFSIIKPVFLQEKKAQSTEPNPEMAPMLDLAVKNFEAANVTMLNDIQEIQSYYECMLILTGWKEMPPEKQNLFKKKKKGQ